MISTTTGPLDGIKVLDLTIWIQGPTAAMCLAALGADVIKVERAGGGDFSRNFGGMNGVMFRREGMANLMWVMFNRSKRALTLDLHEPSAAPVFRKLVEEADIFVTNLHPSALRQFQATSEDLRAINPRLIYARAAGLGEEGPRAEDPCQDTVGMAYSGFMWTAASSTDRPHYLPGSMADVLSGTMLSFGIMAALRERDRTGLGQEVSSSQLQSLLWMQSMMAGAAANFGEEMVPSDPMRPQMPLVNMYECGDGRWIALGLILESHWPPFTEALGIEELRDDVRFAEVGDRIRNSEALTAVIRERLLHRSAADWLEPLRARDLWVSPVNRMRDLPDDPQVVANEYLVRMDDGWSVPALPFSLHGHRVSTRPAPAYGADTDAILGELGLSEEEVTQLRVDGAVW